ncbi:MAG: hypothetical protein K8S27_04580 [Candidatus Omnitrophica bacterium]|nr:hypothetical protein [Candidatus Omnitrophota bacterium]
MNNKYLSGLVLAAFMLSGCFESNQHYTINPDGSGKLQFEVSYNKKDYVHTSSIDLEGIILKLKDKSLGITHWHDIFFEDKGEGPSLLSGTAYFDNINNVSLPIDGLSLDPYKIQFRIEKGQGILEILDPRVKTLKKLTLPEERTQELLMEDKQQFEGIKSLIESTIGKVKMTILFSLPGDVVGVSNMIKKEDNQVFVQFDGHDFFQSAQTVLQDDDWWLRHIKVGIDVYEEGPLGDEDLTNVILGSKSDISASIENISGPLLDCQKELMGKNVYWSSFESGGQVMEITEEDIPLRDINIIRQSVTYDFNLPVDIYPITDKHGYTLTVVATVPDSIFFISGGKLLEAITDREQSLMLIEDAQRMVDDVLLSGSGFYLRFQINLLEPNVWSSRIDKISGYLTGFSGREIKEIDLGIPGFEPGLKSEKIEVRIESLKRDPEDISCEILTMRIHLPREAVLDLRLFDEQDREMNVQTEVLFFQDEEVLIACRLKGRYPLRGRILIKTYADIQKIKMPFSLSHIDLLGRPSKE